MYTLSEYDYELPDSLIAQHPADRRDASRLMVVNREAGQVGHHVFSDLPDLLRPSDLLVVNDTRVIPARLLGQKTTGGRVEALILDYGSGRHRVTADGDVICHCMIKASKRPAPGTRLFFGEGLRAEVLSSEDMIHTLRFSCDGDFETLLYRVGKTPLPPYIRRDDGASDLRDYQTVYAAQAGAVAAPTAGLHFTPALLDRLTGQGNEIVHLTLHVGYGTFTPVRVEDIRDHRMHGEWFSLPAETADAVNRAKREGRRVVAVGTTSVRTLEYAANDEGRLAARSGECDLFLYPGSRFRVVDAMITNFHLPQSTLLLLVSAFAGRERILAAYREAVARSYRFYSYGDAMLIA